VCPSFGIEEQQENTLLLCVFYSQILDVKNGSEVIGGGGAKRRTKYCFELLSSLWLMQQGQRTGINRFLCSYYTVPTIKNEKKGCLIARKLFLYMKSKC
jgi:hypothetical protein